MAPTREFCERVRCHVGRDTRSEKTPFCQEEGP